MRQSTRPRAFTIASTALKSPPPWSQCPCESTAASLAEVDAEDGRVPAEGGAFGPGVEEDGVSLVTDVRPDKQRQAVMRATDRGAGQLGETSRLTEPRPFGDDVFRCGGEAVGGVVHEDEDIEPIDLAEAGVGGVHRHDSTSGGL